MLFRESDMPSVSVNHSSVPLSNPADLKEIDPTTAIQLIQGQRAALLEEQLKDQLNEVKDRNRKIDQLNTTLSSARELIAQFEADDKTSKTFSDLIERQKKNFRNDITTGWQTENALHAKEIYREIEEKIIKTRSTILNAKAKQEQIRKDDKKNYKDHPEWQAQEQIIIQATKEKETAEKAERKKIPDLEVRDDQTKAGKLLADLKSAAKAAGMKLEIANKGELTTMVENIRSQIDMLTSPQQVDMTRLQSYSTKYNDTTEERTTALKQAHEINSKIENNMRGV